MKYCKGDKVVHNNQKSVYTIRKVDDLKECYDLTNGFCTADDYLDHEASEKLNNKEEVMRYKVGDKVVLVSKRGCTWNFEGRMDKYLGNTVVVSQDCGKGDELLFGDNMWAFSYSDIDHESTRILNDKPEYVGSEYYKRVIDDLWKAKPYEPKFVGWSQEDIDRAKLKPSKRVSVGAGRNIGWSHYQRMMKMYDDLIAGNHKQYIEGTWKPSKCVAFNSGRQCGKSTMIMQEVLDLLETKAKLSKPPKSSFEVAREQFMANHDDVYGCWVKGRRTTVKLNDGRVGRVERFHTDEDDPVVEIYEAYLKAIRKEVSIVDAIKMYDKKDKVTMISHPMGSNSFWHDSFWG